MPVDYAQMSKGFLNAIKQYGDLQQTKSDIAGRKAKLESDVMAHQFQAKQNFFWKRQEEEAQRQSKLKFAQDMQAQFAQQDQSGMGDINAPQVRVGAGGDPTLSYPSARDKEFNIKLGLNRISQKEQRGLTLTPQEQKFKETYAGMVTQENTEGLTSKQLVEGRALAKKFYGTRGIKEGTPAIYEELRKGKTIDQIDDELRFAGQSPEFTGTIRNAAQSIMVGKSVDNKQSTFDDLDDLKSIEDKKNYLKRLAISQSPTDMQNKITGKERTVELLDEIEGDLDTLERNGVNTNILSGTYEEVKGKIGTVGNPEIRKLITKINTTIYNYRKEMSGVAFPDKETADYKRIFPGGNKTKELNKANINALREVFGGDIEYFYKRTMGRNNYQELFGEEKRGFKSYKSLWE